MFLYGQIWLADNPPGTFAQVGLNAGDGINFATVPGSGTGDIINIAANINVGVPGVYMFRVDQQSVIYIAIWYVPAAVHIHIIHQ